MASQNDGLGTLGRLPPEIRVLIWHRLLLPPYVSFVFSKNHLAILRTCRQFNEEAWPIAYDGAVLRFHISTWDQERFWLKVSINGGVGFELKCLHDAVTRGFHSLPYKKLKRIGVIVEAAACSWPCELIHLWRQVNNLVELLEHADGLPELRIHLRPKPNCGRRWGWLEYGEPASMFWTKHNYAFKLNDRYYDDYEAILMPFCRLRKVRSASIKMVEPFYTDTIPIFFSRVECVMMREMPFGRFRARPGWSDKEIQAELDDLWMRFDLAIDAFADVTDSSLHLDRYASWYDKGLGSESKYADKLEQVYWSTWPTFIRYHGAILRRYFYMRALNPLSLFTQKKTVVNRICRERYYEFAWYPEKLKAWTEKEVFPHTVFQDEGWDKDEWYRYYEPSRHNYLSVAGRDEAEYKVNDEDAVRFCARFERSTTSYNFSHNKDRCS